MNSLATIFHMDRMRLKRSINHHCSNPELAKGGNPLMTRIRKPVHIVTKGWGREVWIANGELYCGKILEINKGKRCSLHYHKLKTESFYLRSGRLRVRLRESVD